MTRRGPVDPRLARLSAPARRWIAVAALLAFLPLERIFRPYLELPGGGETEE